MAARKIVKKKAKKTAKKIVKKAAKKTVKKAAKKTAKKVVKKAAPKAAKKAVKKTTKKAVKKAITKKATPKASSSPKKETSKPVKLSRFVQKQRDHLVDLHHQLTDSMSGRVSELREAPDSGEASGSGMHQGDAGSSAYDRDFALSVLGKVQDALFEIERALDRIDSGVYGICQISGKKIPNARLEVLPFARLTVECQAQWEKENGNEPFLPDEEIGLNSGVWNS